MSYIQRKDETNLRHNLLLHTNYLESCRRVKASSLQLTTGIGNLRSCSPLIIPSFITLCQLGHKEGLETRLIYPMQPCLHGIYASWLRWNAAEKEAVTTEHSVVPHVLLCHISNLVPLSQLPVCLSFAVKSGISFRGSFSC